MKKKNKTNLSLDEIFIKLIRNRYVMILFLVIITIVFFVNYSKNFDSKLDQGGDNIQYYSLGKALHEGDGYSNTIGFEMKPHTHFPPGYPMFISFIMKFFPNNTNAIKIANGTLLYLTIILLFFLYPISTKNYFISFIACLLCCMQKDLLRYASVMMSETLYLFISVLAIFVIYKLINHYNNRIEKWKNVILIILFLLLIGYIYLVRTMSVTLIIGFTLGLTLIIVNEFILWRKQTKNGNAEETDESKRKTQFYSIVLISMLLVFVVTAGVWKNRNLKEGVVTSTYVSNFSMKENGEVMSSKSDWGDRIKSNTANYITKWIPETIINKEYNLDSKFTLNLWILGLSILALIAFGIIGIKYCRWYMLFYICATMIILILYPEQYGGNRYYVPIIPIFIFLFINGIAKVIEMILNKTKFKNGSITIQSMFVLLLALIFLFPSYIKSQTDNRKIAMYKSWDNIADKRFNDYVDAAIWCGENLPDTARVICRKPEVFYAYSNYTNAESFPWYGEPDSIYDYLVRKKATNIIIDNWFKHAYSTLVPTINKYSDNFALIKTISEPDTINRIDGTYIFEFHPEWGYHGEYVDGKKEGQGRYQWSDGTFYEGSFSNDLINGFGRLNNPDGTYYEGFWVDDMKNGQGEERYRDSTIYRGTFKDDNPNGYGEYFDKNGNLLVKCTWVNGIKEGKGVEYFNDGRMYKGNFKDNLPNGYGEYYLKDGILIAKGFWVNGNLVDSL